MTLSAEERERLADVVALQPTKNGELEERWGMADGGEVHRYLEEHLKEHYYRDENSLIRATAEAADLVDVEPGVEGDADGVDVVRVPPLAARTVGVLAGPDGEPDSVVAVLHALREAGVESTVDDVRSTLWSLRDKGVVEVVQRAVPTFRLALPREELSVEELGERTAGGADGTDGQGNGDGGGDADPAGPVLETIEPAHETES